MLVFIIPLKSKTVSQSWERTSQLFERCVRSICNQTNSNYHILVVCNEKPETDFNHSKIEYINVDFLPTNTTFKAKDIDKGRRIITGFMRAKNLMPSHVMAVDADDCVSRNIAAFVDKNVQCNGWFLNSGYVYQEDSSFIYYRRSHFYSWCGSSHIIKYNLLQLPESQEKQACIKYKKYYNHQTIADRLREKATPLEALPFVGVVYTIGNGENIYQKGFDTVHSENRGLLFRLKDSLNFRLLTPSIRHEFGLSKLD